ncbi:MAG: aldolase/citrate lyase family protein [Clostridiales bacterium]|nr:aldolase/citrate lyase family protein [Clostridiales bacterium]
MLKLFYITNNPKVAAVVQEAGVDHIFIDMEYIGKDERQPNMDTVKNHHTVDDVRAVRRVLDTSQLLVRVNPINTGSAEEINAVIDAGADVVMLPM